MAEITAKMVKELREQTGAGMMDVKAARVEANGDMEEARTSLRKKRLATASKKAGRITAEGMVTSVVEGNVGVLVEVNCETDFVARTEGFRNFAAEVAKVILDSKADTVDAINAETWPGSGETVQQKTQELIGSIKENITIRRFTRYETGAEGALASSIH